MHLCDRYFQSRPELFGQNGNGQGVSGLAGTGVSTAAAASVVQRAFATAGNATGPGSGGVSGKSANPYAASMPAVRRVSNALLRPSMCGYLLRFFLSPTAPILRMPCRWAASLLPRSRSRAVVSHRTLRPSPPNRGTPHRYPAAGRSTHPTRPPSNASGYPAPKSTSS